MCQVRIEVTVKFVYFVYSATSIMIIEYARYDSPRDPFLKYKCRFKPGHVEKGEKGKHFSYPNYFTYPVLQHWSRCPDNRGCTVFAFKCSIILLLSQTCQICMICIQNEVYPDNHSV